MHRVVGGDDSPDGWQRAAQAASVVMGVLWVVPMYLVAAELFGGASAWLAVILALVVPTTAHVMADVLSEGIFLLFWTWGLYTALRFLRDGSFVWLPPTIGFAALAYLSRPEGLLLPMALVACLAAMPLLRSTRRNPRRTPSSGPGSSTRIRRWRRPTCSPPAQWPNPCATR
jgi:4-amino-4-deoxy-L-arabinose transferase-like glycosyltransferase